MKTQNKFSEMNFIFTPEGFVPDTAAVKDEEILEYWMRRGGYPALYEAGLGEAPGGTSPFGVPFYTGCLPDFSAV